MNKFEGGYSFGDFLIHLVVISLIWMYISKDDSPQIFANEVKDKFSSFYDQNIKTRESIEDALEEEKKSRLMNYNYNNKATLKFIDAWNNAEESVEDLKDSLDESVAATDDYFDYLYDELDNIENNKTLSNRMKILIENKKRKMTSKMSLTQNSLHKIENMIEAGNEIISAIKITGALNTVELKNRDLDQIISTSGLLLNSIDVLIKESSAILNEEIAMAK